MAAGTGSGREGMKQVLAFGMGAGVELTTCCEVARKWWLHNTMNREHAIQWKT